MKKKLLRTSLLLCLLVVGLVSKDIYLVFKLALYFTFWWSIILLTKYLSRDFSDGRKNDFYGE